jgi:Domain of unknown function (DUF2017)
VDLSRQIERDPAGGIRLSFREEEVLLLRELLAELEALLEDPDDPALRRLFPPAHADSENDEQYRSLVGDQLLRGRSDALAAVSETLGSETLGPEEADAWLRTLNDLRLVLGTRLAVGEEIDFEELDLSEPRGRDLAVYGYLSWLQEQLVEALGSGPGQSTPGR